MAISGTPIDKIVKADYEKNIITEEKQNSWTFQGRVSGNENDCSHE